MTWRSALLLSALTLAAVSPFALHVAQTTVRPSFAETMDMAQQVEVQQLNQTATEQFGLSCMSHQIVECRNMIRRAQHSAALRAAMLSASSSGSLIVLENPDDPNFLLLAGSITRIGNIAINSSQSDEAIVGFLSRFKRP